ncbi:MAG: hypothetical protein HQL26_02470 [Candidatus Omnitrophica bacterium]|nr:hypothetical protein [Candidatus Omnitrophota bacterium]
MKSREANIGRKIIASFLIFTFMISNGSVPVRYANAQESFTSGVGLSAAFTPSLLKGVKIYADNPFRLDFILDKGGTSSQRDMKIESERLIKYFLAAVTVPEKDLWVNLSPYEKNRIIPDAFGVTQMGRDLLAQDYILKQITASLTNPEGEIGREFWNKIYSSLSRDPCLRGDDNSFNIPTDILSKVWIVPEKAVVYEAKDSAYVVESKLKVMTDQDYALSVGTGPLPVRMEESTQQVIREVIIPLLEKEVNTGKNFAQLRQVYNSLILAMWFKDKIKESIFGKAYVDQNKTGGIDIADKNEKEKIWAKYVETFKKGAYNYIKEEYDPNIQQIIPRKYFSGGFTALGLQHNLIRTHDRAMLQPAVLDNAMIVKTNFTATNQNTDKVAMIMLDRGLELTVFRRPEPAMVNNFSWEDIYSGGRLAFGDKEDVDARVKQILSSVMWKELENALPYVDQFVDRIFAEYPDYTIIVAGRDGEIFYDALSWKKLPATKVRLIHSGHFLLSDLIHKQEAAAEKGLIDPVVKKFLEDAGLTPQAIKNKEKFLFVDTGFRGSAGQILKEIFWSVFPHAEGLRFESVLMAGWDPKLTYLRPIYAEPLIFFDVPKDKLVHDFSRSYALIPQEYKNKTTPYTTNFTLGTVLQLLPRYHGHSLSAILSHDGRLEIKFTEVPVNWDMDTIDYRGFDSDIVNPLAALMVQKRTLEYFAAKQRTVLGPDRAMMRDYEKDDSVAFALKSRKISHSLEAADENNPYSNMFEIKSSGFVSHSQIHSYLGEDFDRIVAENYSKYIPQGGRVLDLMSGYHTHIGENLNLNQAAGVGLNAYEMYANPKLTSFNLQDLNTNPKFPSDWNEHFDAVIMTSGIAYLTSPQDVFRSAAKTLKPGGVFMLAFDRHFLVPEAMPLWETFSNEERLAFVLKKLELAGGFKITEHKIYPQDGITIIVCRKSAISGQESETQTLPLKESFQRTQLRTQDMDPIFVEAERFSGGPKMKVKMPAAVYQRIETRDKGAFFIKGLESLIGECFYEINRKTRALEIKQISPERVSFHGWQYFSMLLHILRTAVTISLKEEDTKGAVTVRLTNLNNNKQVGELALRLNGILNVRLFNTNVQEWSISAERTREFLDATKKILDEQFKTLPDFAADRAMIQASMIKDGNKFQSFQLAPRTALYPGGLDFRIFDLFPNLEVAHFVNNRPFRVEFLMENLFFYDISPYSNFFGHLAYKQMMVRYLQSSADYFISDDLQDSIMYGTYLQMHWDKIQIGMEPFVLAELEKREAKNIQVKQINEDVWTGKLFQIEFDDKTGRHRTVYYHETDAFKAPGNKILSDGIANGADLVFLKGWNVEKYPSMVGQILRPGTIIAQDRTEKREDYKVLGRLGGVASYWGQLGHNNYMRVYEYQPLAGDYMIKRSPADAAPMSHDQAMNSLLDNVIFINNLTQAGLSGYLKTFRDVSPNKGRQLAGMGREVLGTFYFGSQGTEKPTLILASRTKNSEGINSHRELAGLIGQDENAGVPFIWHFDDKKDPKELILFSSKDKDISEHEKRGQIIFSAKILLKMIQGVYPQADDCYLIRLAVQENVLTKEDMESLSFSQYPGGLYDLRAIANLPMEHDPVMNIFPPRVAERAQALRDTIAQVRKEQPDSAIHFENTVDEHGELPEEELVADPKQKLLNDEESERYGDRENRIAYWANQYDVKIEFLKLVRDYQSGQIKNIKDFESRLLKMHRVLLLGYDGQSLYAPQTFLHFHIKSRMELKNEIDAIAGRFFDRLPDNKVKIIYEDFQRLMKYFNSVNLTIELNSFTADLSRFYSNFLGDWQTTGYLFEYGNNSLVMNMFNGFLRLADFKGISHNEFDSEAYDLTRGLRYAKIAAIRMGTKVELQESDIPPVYKSFLTAIKAANDRDRAQTSNTGGIDLTRDKMGLQVRGTGDGVQFKFDAAMIQKLQNASGLTPVIIDIRPMTTTVPVFLGLSEEIPAAKLSMR